MVADDRLPLVSAGDHTMQRAGALDALGSRHAPRLPTNHRATSLIAYCRPDPNGVRPAIGTKQFARQVVGNVPGLCPVRHGDGPAYAAMVADDRLPLVPARRQAATLTTYYRPDPRSLWTDLRAG